MDWDKLGTEIALAKRSWSLLGDLDCKGGALLFIWGHTWVYSLNGVQHCKTDHSTTQAMKIMLGKEK